MMLVMFLGLWLFSSPAEAVNDLVDPDFKRVLKDHGYPPKVYVAEEMIKQEMKDRGTCLEAFEASIGKDPDGYLDQETFLRWQQEKEFEARSSYRQNNAWVEYEWGGERTIYYPLHIGPRDVQLVLPLDSANNRILVAWDMDRLSVDGSEWQIVYGYENSSDLHLKKLKPLKKPTGYAGVVLYSPPGKMVHFRVVKLGFHRQEFSQELPFLVSYEELAREHLIPEEIWYRYQNDECQALIRQGDRVKFIQP
jgi:hypothetical protein